MIRTFKSAAAVAAFVAAAAAFVLSDAALAAPTDEQRLVHAIGVIDGIEGRFTKSGKPKVKALRDVLGGVAVSAADRDKAWAAYQAGPTAVETPAEIKIVEKLVEVPGPERIVEVKHIRVQKFEEAMGRTIARLESAIAAEAARPPRVVEIEKKVLVRDNAQADAKCVELRGTFLASVDRWGSDDEEAGKEAIERGCW